MNKLRKLFITDCDGVLTPMYTYYSTEGRHIKRFSSHDSYAIKKLKKIGYKIVILTSDKKGFGITQQRADDWGVTAVYSNKKEVYINNLRDDYEEIVFVGNGPEDIIESNLVDRYFAPCDAQKELLNLSHQEIIVLNAKGGEGVIMEVCEYILNG